MKKLKFLLDANISHETADHLESLGYDAKTVAQFGFSRAEDQQVFNLAQKEKRVRKSKGVIILRLKNQTIESVNYHLSRLLTSRKIAEKEIKSQLIIIEEDRYRLIKRSI